MQNQPRPDLSRPEARPASAAPRKRFHIEKLEERIAPKKGGKGTKNCGGSSVGTSSGSLF